MPPVRVAVDVATGTTSQLFDGRDIVRLPSRGRYVQPFALLMPGVVSTTPYDRRNNNSAVNGIRPTHNAWLIDGGYNIDTGGNWGSPLAPNIETVAEFRAIRGNYSAEFGTGGGSQFNVITKGGTNELHGSLYYFHRNDKLNSPNFIDSVGRNWTALQGRLDNTNEKNFRIDHNINDNHRLMWRYTPEYRLARYREGPGFDIFTREDRVPARNMAANYSAALRPNLLNDFNWVRSHNRIMYFPGDVSPAKWGINVQQLFADNEQTYPLSSLNLGKVPDRVPTISSIVGYAGLNNTAPWSNYQTIYEFKDNLTWIKHAHTIKTGFSYAYEIKFE